MANEVGTGVVGGAASGAALGTSILPGWGTAIGALAGGVYGGIQGNETKKAREKAERLANEIPKVDPQMAKHLGELRRHRTHLLAGTGSLFGAQKRAIQQAQAQTGANLARTTGGSSGTLIDALLRSQGQTDRSIGEAFGQQNMLAADAFNAELPIISNMVDRRLRLDSYARDTASARWASQQQANQTNMMSGLANLPSLTQGAPKAPSNTMMQYDASVAPTMMSTRNMPIPNSLGAPNYAVQPMQPIRSAYVPPTLPYTPL